MSKMVKEAAVDGFVYVITDDRDNRVQLVNVTQKGAGLIGDIRREIVRRCDNLLLQNVVAREELDQANGAFTKLLNHFDAVGFSSRFDVNLH